MPGVDRFLVIPAWSEHQARLCLSCKKWSSADIPFEDWAFCPCCGVRWSGEQEPSRRSFLRRGWRREVEWRNWMFRSDSFRWVFQSFDFYRGVWWEHESASGAEMSAIEAYEKLYFMKNGYSGQRPSPSRLLVMRGGVVERVCDGPGYSRSVAESLEAAGLVRTGSAPDVRSS